MNAGTRPDQESVWIWVGAACNCRCRHCALPTSSSASGASVDDLLRELPSRTFLSRTGPLAVLLGGDPFVRKDVFRLLGTCREVGYRPGVVTNGRALWYPQARRRLRELELAYLRVQLFGWAAEHDRITRVTGSFRQALDGVSAFAHEDGGAATKLDLALVLAPSNVGRLPKIIENLSETFLHPDHRILLNCGPLAHSGDRTALADLRSILNCLAWWNADGSRPLLVWEGLPECCAPSPSHLSIALPRPNWRATHCEPRLTCLGATPEVSHVAACAPCGVRARCMGSVGAILAPSTGELPGTAFRANSFNYVRQDEELPLALVHSECGGCRPPRQEGPERRLWLVDAKERCMSLYVTDTRDFRSDEIGRVKQTLCQLFLDTSATATLDEYKSSLLRVMPDPFCQNCGSRTMCGGRHRVQETNPFWADEQRLIALVGSLSGRVLDVGCGNGPYREVLAPSVHCGRVEFHALDPHRTAIEELRQAIPEGHYHVGTVEAFVDRPASFDHVLCLRALDHLCDIAEAFTRIAWLLRPGGSFTLVECTPFALLRERSQVARADRAEAAGHQHLRNWESTDVLPLARLHSFTVLEHRPVSRNTNNQWILRLMRDNHRPSQGTEVRR